MDNIPTRDNLMAKQNAAMKKIVIEKIEEAIVDPTIKYVKIDGRIPEPLVYELRQKGYFVEYMEEPKTKYNIPSVYTHISWN